MDYKEDDLVTFDKNSLVYESSSAHDLIQECSAKCLEKLSYIQISAERCRILSNYWCELLEVKEG